MNMAIFKKKEKNTLFMNTKKSGNLNSYYCQISQKFITCLTFILQYLKTEITS